MRCCPATSIDVAGAGVPPAADAVGPHQGQAEREGRGRARQLAVLPGQQQPEVKTIADFTRRTASRCPRWACRCSRARCRSLRPSSGAQDDFNVRQDLGEPAAPRRHRGHHRGGSEINSHFGNPPFQDQELAGNPKAHIVLNSYDVLGGPASARAVRHREIPQREPEDLQGLLDALDEAAKFVTANKEKAADIYMKREKSKLDRATAAQDHQEPGEQFKISPQNTYALAEFCTGWARSRTSRRRGRTTSSTMPERASRAAEGVTPSPWPEGVSPFGIVRPSPNHLPRAGEGADPRRCCRSTASASNTARRSASCAPRTA
jgi:NitT/TauT family transport system substrate-binding protein